MTDVWDDVVGQEAAVTALREAARTPSAMTHAWLVTGPPGSGRSVAARAFAAALQADDGDDSPEAQNARRRVLAGTHPDVHVAATEKSIIAITEARELVTIAQRAPTEGRWRVIIVEDADRMVERTSNVLLKAIEEPPPRTVWLLCAPSPQDVVTTIRSRCRSVSLRVPPAGAVAELLVRRHGIGAELALEAALAAQSHIGLATRLALDAGTRDRRSRVLELAASIRGVGDAVLAAGELVEVAGAQAKAATEDRDARERAALLHAIGAEEADATARSLPVALRSQLRQLEDEQKKRARRAVHDVLDRAMTDLLSLYRDVLVVQLGADVELVNGAHADRIRALAEASTPQQSVRRMDAISQARTRLEGNVAPLLATEAMAVALRPQA